MTRKVDRLDSARAASLRADPPSPPFEVRDTGRYGHGSFATVDIPAGSTIQTLVGVTISYPEVVRRVLAGVEGIDDPLQVGVRTFLDLEESSRQFNHSCDPNAGLRKRSELFALRDIAAGEEITFDYSTTISPTTWWMRCECGAPNCRGVVADVRSIPPRTLQRYIRLGALQRFMLRLIRQPGWRKRRPGEPKRGRARAR